MKLDARARAQSIIQVVSLGNRYEMATETMKDRWLAMKIGFALAPSGVPAKQLVHLLIPPDWTRWPL